MADHLSENLNEGVKNTIPQQGSTEQDTTIPSVGDKTGASKPSVFSKDGAIGHMFQPDGAIGGTAQKVGGPFDKDGMIGSNFTADGSIGGTVQKTVERK